MLFFFFWLIAYVIALLLSTAFGINREKHVSAVKRYFFLVLPYLVAAILPTRYLIRDDDVGPVSYTHLTLPTNREV